MASLGEVLSQLEKVAEIKTSPRQLFTYIPFPDDLRQRFESLARHVVPAGKVARDIDHITLLYIPKAEADVAHEKVDQVLRSMRDVCERVRPIKAKVQGWGYFDGALDDGVKKTALVGLIDAPGLEDLHVELKSAMRQLGLNDAGTHIFTPHVTFAYLDHGERVKDLPMLDGEFDIDKVMFANADKHEVKLLGHKSLGEKAAAAGRVDLIPGGKGDRLQPRDAPPAELTAGKKVEREHTSSSPLAQEIALDHLKEDPHYYSKLRRCMPGEVPRLGKQAAMHFGHQVAAGMKIEHTPGRTAEKAKSIVLARLRKDPEAYKHAVDEQLWDAAKLKARQLEQQINKGDSKANLQVSLQKLMMFANDAKEAANVDRCKVCSKKATVKVLWAEGRGYQPACEDHKEQVAKPFKAKDDFSSFKRYKSAAADDSNWQDLVAQAHREMYRDVPTPEGFGIRDGRGYGPYEMGYYHDEASGDALPLGPNGEKLSKEYDYQPGPKGYLQGRREPLKKVGDAAKEAAFPRLNAQWGRISPRLRNTLRGAAAGSLFAVPAGLSQINNNIEDELPWHEGVLKAMGYGAGGGSVVGAGLGAVQSIPTTALTKHKELGELLVPLEDHVPWLRGVTTKSEARKIYRDAARAAHPDLGGSPEVMKQLNSEWDFAQGHPTFKKLSFLLRQAGAFSLSTSAARQEPREQNDYTLGKGTADAGGTGSVVNSAIGGVPKQAAHVDELREALRRIGMLRVGKAPLAGPHLNEAAMLPAMPAGGASRHLDFFGLTSPRTPAGQKATNILGGMHEGFERAAVGRGDRSGFHGHASPRVLLDENNMLAQLRGEGADEAKRVFGAMRGAESPEAAEVAQAVSRLSGGRMPFSYGETRLPKAMKERLQGMLRR